MVEGHTTPMSAPTVRGRQKLTWLAWILCGMIAVITLISVVMDLINRKPDDTTFNLVGNLIWGLLPIVFAVLAALILTRQPHNVIGWLLMLPALLGILPVDAYLGSFSSAPAHPSFLFLVVLWYINWNWLLVIFPIFFIAVLFPTGQPPSPRWRWLLVAGLSMCAIFLFLTTFSKTFEATELGWTIANPIGFLPSDVWGVYFSVPWIVGLLSLTVLSVGSLFIRYHRATAMEREQIKWLLYACALFAAIYIPLYWISDLNSILRDVWNILFIISILAIPAAITVAILRYRLWDIDLIIRRTLIYGGLTLTLGAVYFGSVILLQELLQRFAGGQSTVAIVLSTLLIAALFSPLRRRIQRDIDRRFYRKKYNAEQILETFAAAARSETDLESLAGRLVEVVKETMQPEHASLWLKGKPPR